MMDQLHGFSSLMAIAILVICYLGCQIHPNLAYSLTSQYIGSAPSSDNEHLLLFKLPEAISTQLLESQTTNPNNRQNYQQFLTKDPRLSSSTLNYGPTQQLESNSAVQEQAVSLTIPLSTLHTVERSPPPSSYVSANRLQTNEISQQQTSQLALELAVADYIEDNNKKQHGSTGSGQMTISQGNNNHGSVESLLMPTSRSNFAYQDLNNDRRSLMPQLSLQPDDQVSSPIYLNHYTNQSLQQIDNQRAIQPPYVQLNVQKHVQSQSELPVSVQPSLWRESQTIAPSSTHDLLNGSGIPNILTKLSSSSPDLLLRLRNLLKRSAGHQQIGPLTSMVDDNPAQRYLSPNANLRLANNRQITGELDSHSELLMANNVAPSELHNLFKNYLKSQDIYEHTPLTEGSLLSGQNFSKQEIKIPLIVIAMPRILSLKRNQPSANSTNNSYNSTEQLNPLAFSQKLTRQQTPQSIAANLTQKGFIIANGTHLYQISSNQPQANYSEATSTNSSNLYHLVSQQQQYLSTTSLPLHTMAPYAQQFSMPKLSSSPLIRQFVPLRQRESSKQQSYYLPNYLGQLTPQTVANQSGSYELSSIQSTRPTSHLARQLFYSNLNRQPIELQNTTEFRGGTQQTADSANIVGGGPSFSVIGAAPTENYQYSNANVAQKSHLSDSVPQSNLPIYYVQQTQDQIIDNQQQQQPQMIYLNSTAQRRSNSLMAQQASNESSYDRPAQMAIDDTARASHNQRNNYSHNNVKNIDLSSLAASRISLLEEQLRRLHPLFQANKSYNPQDAASTELSNTALTPRLSSSQLVSLFSGLAERKSLGGPQEKDNESNDVQSHRRKSPKMVLMIV